ncbi:16S rRNA (guanine(527)-N(7))-methyltransferase RsmG [Noviherbaspirillum aridicola]|uniref:Ribosomal RNA small subunit methyltransferase G n=1 Tax=Noviherbaspirillum aridicola TaxID=2849687 RepID=A0ABQ4QA55_9BURK|nr:16S rRNA (guanine(527)-N(7))-methyltransferase RsmG [Noviherbaspirillum aridicola]GIZ54093.1 ribosomal RNA small subunit methyltransferase G [Noviherbaspirillum aridicola]
MRSGFDRSALSQRLADGSRALGLSLSDAQLSQLMDYLQLLAKWNSVYNLTAVRDLSQMVTQHLLDSLAAVPAFAAATRVLDVGAGGGLPGIVLAVARPDLAITLIDTVHKKTAFLTQVKAELGLQNVTVKTGRVEQLQADPPFDVITSRAFAELKDFITWSSHLLSPDGCFLALKGVYPREEMERLPQGWTVVEVVALDVPGLGAERHIVRIQRGEQQ